MSISNGIISSNIHATKTTPSSTISPSPQENKYQSQSGYIKYMECLKNHAAAIGGNATDGCGEFMPGGEQGSLEALMCAACNCHRNFHKKICLPAEYFLASSSSPSPLVVYNPQPDPDVGMMIMTMKREEHDDGDEVQVMVKKRYRSKFSQEQKEKMLAFAEKCEWKIQNVDDSELRQFCQEIGIKRKVLRIWMHNNKHNHMNYNSTTT